MTSTYTKSYIAGTKRYYYENAVSGTKSVTVSNNSRWYLIINFGSHILPTDILRADYTIPPFCQARINLPALVFAFTWVIDASSGAMISNPSEALEGMADIIYSNAPTMEEITALDAKIEQYAQIIYDSKIIAPALVGTYNDLWIPGGEKFLRYVRCDFTDDDCSLDNFKIYIEITNLAHTVVRQWLMGKWLFKGALDDKAPLIWEMRSIIDGIKMDADSALTLFVVAGNGNEVFCSWAYSV